MGKEVKRIALKDIVVDRNLLPRDSLVDEAVKRYHEVPVEAFPPVIVFQIGGEYKLADGLHRLQRHTEAGAEEIEAEVRYGSEGDVTWVAVGENARHGLHFTRDQQRRAIEMILADSEGVGKSDALIAEQVGVSDKTVARARAKLPNVSTPERSEVEDSGESETPEVERRMGRDGKVRRVRKKAQKRAQKPPGSTEGEEDVSEFVEAVLATQGQFGDMDGALDGLQRQAKEIGKLVQFKGTFPMSLLLGLFGLARTVLRIVRPDPKKPVCRHCKGDGCAACAHRGWKRQGYVGKDPATAKQLAVLKKRGWDVDDLNKKEATKLIDATAESEGWAEKPQKPK